MTFRLRTYTMTTDAACEVCGSLGRWNWRGYTDAVAVARNGGWGFLQAPPEP